MITINIIPIEINLNISKSTFNTYEKYITDIILSYSFKYVTKEIISEIYIKIGELKLVEKERKKKLNSL